MIHVFTHDSIGLGEDGPTHQPVEQLASLRAIPGLERDPALRRQRGRRGLAGDDATSSHQPVALVLTRQDVPMLDRSTLRLGRGPAPGGYVLADCRGGEPEVILIATGSEVALAVAAYEELSAEGVRARVVSLPSLVAVRPPGRGLPRRACCRRRCRRGSRSSRPRPWAGTATSAREGEKIGMHTFGASAPLKDVQTKFGFTPGAGRRGGARSARASCLNDRRSA